MKPERRRNSCVPDQLFVRCMSPILAQSGDVIHANERPLSRAKRTSSRRPAMSAYDPKRTELVFHHCPVPVSTACENCGVIDNGQCLGFAPRFTANPLADPGGVRPNRYLAFNIRSYRSVR